MTGQAIGRYIFTVIAGLLVWVVVYWVKRKLSNPDLPPDWGGIGVVAFVSLVFVFLSGASWFGLYIQGKSIDVDATFIGVKPDTVIQQSDGNKIYKWKLECQWNDPQSGRQITFTSEPFEGTDLYYNRSKIKVSVYPARADTFYEVDLSFLSSKEQSGIKLITENLLSESDLSHQRKLEKEQVNEKDQELRREKGRGLAVMLNRLVFGGIVILVVIALIIGGWMYMRHRASQNRIQEFARNTESAMQKKGWTFSFQPYEKPFEGVMGMLRNDEGGPYPYGFARIANGNQWSLEVSINPESTRGRYSRQEFWLMTTGRSRLVIPLQVHQNDASFVLMEIPGFFDKGLKSQLAQAYTSADKKYLADIPSVNDQALIHLYVQRLFDDFKNVIYQSTEVHRTCELHAGTQLLSMTNNPKQADQIFDQNVKSGLMKITKSEKGGYGMMLSGDRIVISTLNPALDPDSIQAMVNLGMQVKAGIEKMQ